MRKFIYSALAMGAAFGIAFGAQTADVAAEESETPATTEAPATSSAPESVIGAENVDLNGDILTINSEANQILVGVAKESKKGLNVSTWDTYDNTEDGYVNVDLSKVNNAKDAYIEIKADFESDEAAFIVKIPASDKIKAKYDKKTGKITVTDSKGGALPTGAHVIYQAGNEGGDLEDLDLATYQMSGGIVYVSDMYFADPVAGTSTDKFDLAFPARRAKEVKLTIGKLANAPKVKANYVKGEITIPKGAYYRSFVASDESVPATQQAVTKATVFKVDSVTDYAKFKFNGTEEFAVDVQTAGESGKKLASKVGHYVFSALTATDPSKVTFEDATDWDAKKVKPTLKLKNTDSKNAYTITWWAVGKTEKTAAKTTKVAAGKDNVKLANVATACGITVQRQGNAKKGEESWAGTTVKLIDGTNTTDAAEGGSSEDPAEPTPAPATYSVTKTGQYVDSLTLPTAAVAVGTKVTITSTTAVTYQGNLSYHVRYGEGSNLTEIPSSQITVESDGNSFSFTMPNGPVVISAT